jgi:hypothetical protein
VRRDLASIGLYLRRYTSRPRVRGQCYTLRSLLRGRERKNNVYSALK